MLAAAGAACSTANADLIGVNFSTGYVYTISTADGSATQITKTATGITGLDRDAGGSLLALTDGIAGTLAVLDEQSGSLDPVGRVGAGFTFEGGLAVGGTGEIFGGTRLAGGGRAIFRIDPASGAMSESVTLSRSSVDLNGLAFRSDGALVAIDALANELVSIDTGTGDVSVIAPLITPDAGAVGGLAIEHGVGYYVTAGTVSGSDGDNSLYRIDLFTGAQSLVGSLGADAGSGFGISAIAPSVVPAPGASLLLCGLSLLAARRRVTPVARLATGSGSSCRSSASCR